ncbi:hypothetical protein PIB30_055562, partial [Stylosanthes scabra]|nr:hypothetical protein [Stylosanthes scabra]
MRNPNTDESYIYFDHPIDKPDYVEDVGRDNVEITCVYTTMFCLCTDGVSDGRALMQPSVTVGRNFVPIGTA